MTTLQKGKVTIYVFSAIIIILLLMLFFVPSKNSNETEDNGKLNIVTTFFPIYDFTESIFFMQSASSDLSTYTVDFENDINLDILFTQTPEVSSFRPSEVQKVANADILIINGAGIEPIIEEIVKAAGNDNLFIIDTSKDIELRDNDPHIWLDPQNARKQVNNIHNGLIQYANEYPGSPLDGYEKQKGAGYYMNTLAQLDLQITNSVEQYRNKKIITFHPAFGYFADRYELEVLAVFEESPGKEPTPSDLAEIMHLVQTYDIKALFVEPQFSPKVVETLAQDLAIEVVTLDPIESGNIGTDSYITLMQKNLEQLNAVLQ